MTAGSLASGDCQEQQLGRIATGNRAHHLVDSGVRSNHCPADELSCTQPEPFRSLCNDMQDARPTLDHRLISLAEGRNKGDVISLSGGG